MPLTVLLLFRKGSEGNSVSPLDSIRLFRDKKGYCENVRQDPGQATHFRGTLHTSELPGRCFPPASARSCARTCRGAQGRAVNAARSDVGLSGAKEGSL